MIVGVDLRFHLNFKSHDLDLFCIKVVYARLNIIIVIHHYNDM